MKAFVAASFAFLLASAAAQASSLDVDTGSFLNPSPRVSWWGAAVYMNDQGELGVGVTMGASVGLWSGQWQLDEMSGSVLGGTWSRSADFDSPGGECYTTSVAAQTFDQYAQQHGPQICVPRQNPYPQDPRDPIILCDDGDYDGQCSPVVINLEPGPYTMSGPDDPVEFDIDADGSRNRITWIARNSAVAFVALDRNGNGVIDDGSELFGNSTVLRSGLRASNGFIALQELDRDLDELVTADDEGWDSLLLWTDRNHDGISQAAELQKISASPVRGIGTRHHWTGRRDSAGNLFGYIGLAHMTWGTRPIYDVFFASVP